MLPSLAMRIAIMTIGTRGDVQPYVNLGRGLHEAGYSVRLVTSRGFDDLAGSAGLDYVPIDLDFAEMMKDPQVVAALKSPIGLLRFWSRASGLVRRSLDACTDAAVDADAIVHHPKATAAPHLAERYGLPLITAALQPILSPTRSFPSPLLPFGNLGPCGNRLSHRFVLKLMASGGFPGVLSTWRAERLGLPPKPVRPTNSVTIRGALVPVLYGFSPTLVPPPPDWSEGTRVTGAWFGTGSVDWRPPDSLANFLASGPPPVYVGFGSMATGNAAEKGRMVAAALAKAGLRGIIAGGWGGLAAESSADVRVIDQAPHAWLFPRCVAVVHHGGAGTTHEGLRWGRPTLVCPVFGDQPWWGHRVAALGAGPPPIPQRRLSVNRLADALRDLVGNPGFAQRAQDIAFAMRHEDGVGAAVAAISRNLGRPDSSTSND